MSDSTSDRFLTVKQVSERLGVSLGCVYQLVAAGRVQHIRVGLGRGTIRIREDSVDAYIESVTLTERDKDEKPPRRAASSKKGVFRHLDAERLTDAWRE